MSIGKKIKNILNNIFAKQSIYFQDSSYPSYGLDAEQLAEILREADRGDVLRQTELFEEMEEKDTHLSSVLQTRKLAVSGLEWEIVPGEDSNQKKRADFISEKLNEIENFDSAILDILDAIGKGFSVAEIIYKFDKGSVGIERIDHVSQRRFTFAAEDGIILRYPRILTDEAVTYGIELPDYKFIYFKYNARSGIAARGGLLRPITWMYLFKNYSLKDWVIFNERYAMPSRIGKYSGGATEAQIKELEKAVKRIGSDAAAIISDNTVIDLIESKARGDVDAYEKLCSYCDNQVSKAVLGQTLTTDAGASGSYAHAKVHNMVRDDLLKSDCISLSNVINEQLIKPLVLLNFGDVPIPKFQFKIGKRADLETDSKIVLNLRQAGFGDVPISYIHKHYNIPVPVANEKTLGAAALLKSKLFSMKANQPDSSNQLATLKKAMNDNSENALGELFAPIFQLAADSSSYEELIGKLEVVYDKANDSEITALLSEAVYLAQIWGRLDNVK